jgi:hypothetical protein
MVCSEFITEALASCLDHRLGTVRSTRLTATNETADHAVACVVKYNDW